MDKFLTAREEEELARFRFAAGNQEPPHSVKMAELLEFSRFQEYINRVAEKTAASSPRSVNSIFMKRYAFLAVIYLYAMTKWNKQLNVSPENLSLVDHTKSSLWLLDFYFDKKETGTFSNDRAEWRKDALVHLFRDHIFPMMEMTGRAGKISKLILWENIAIYIFWLYEIVFPKELDSAIRKRAEEDFEYIVHQAPGSCFGNYHQNPLKRYFTSMEPHPITGEEVRVRKTCCFSYEAGSIGTYCKTCPHICRKNNNRKP